MKKHRSFGFTTRYVVIVGVLLFAANVILGLVMMHQSETVMQTMIRKNMLDLSNTAAALLDGDKVGAFTEADVGSPAYREALRELSVFQNNADIEFIYAVRQAGEECFVFILDADPVDPGAFGEEILVTPALIQAGKGVATVDDSPAQDRWGNFYSTYSPVFDSNHKVAAIVGIDFSAEWYEKELRSHTLSVSVVSILSVLFGAFVMVLITGKLRQKFLALDRELSALAGNVDELTEEITSNPGYKESLGPAPQVPELKEDGEVSDELEALGIKIRSMQAELGRYLRYMHSQAFTDSLTRVGNTNAYQEEIRALNEQIKNGKADFCAVAFDLDNLKFANDEYGHACGDRVIRGAAWAISGAFGKERTFRIGGDEFVAIPLGISEEELEEKCRKVRDSIADFNARPNRPEAELALSMGAAFYRPGVDRNFREVFLRADEALYENKGEHHRRMPVQRVR
ncbi:MAG: GGDEF domain-containing protein [Oscillospiraceae bacterium]|nr:GGDEF domain-containing protein [Oscillospiraceae bacterium]